MGTKRFFLSGLAMLILLCSFAPPAWIQFQNKTGRFKATFPGKPEVSAQDVNTEIGPLKMNMFMFTGTDEKDENKIYGIAYADYPAKLINSGMPASTLDTFFANAIEGSARNMNGEVIEEEKIALKTFPGRQVKIRFSDGEAIMKLRIFLVKNRAYFLEVGYETKNDGNPTINKFFSSFALL